MESKSGSQPSAGPTQEPNGKRPEGAQGARHNDGRDVDTDLSHSLNHLAISSSSSSQAKPPRSSRPLAIAVSPLKPVNTNNNKSPNSPSPSPNRPGSSLQSPLNSPSFSTARAPSRAGTPSLHRKASLNSLHSANSTTQLRRASSASILSPAHSRTARSPLREMSPEPPVPTANSIAHDRFKSELEAHQGLEPGRQPETIVILQDDCYGHRYERPRTSKSELSNVVERPERLKACVLGVSAAYVQLGRRHKDGAFSTGSDFHPPAALSTIPFTIRKTDRRLPLTSQAVTNVHGNKWMEELRLMCDTAESKLATNGKELQRPEMDRGQGPEAPPKFHDGDLYLCSGSLDAMEGGLGGVCEAIDAVFEPEGPKRAFVAIRPPGHHCSAGWPSGFCWINNVHVGIMHAALTHDLTHAAIIDFDLHHGDGSQEIAWQHNAQRIALSKTASKFKNAPAWKKSSIGYFSLHDINSFPCEEGDAEKVRNASLCIENAHGQNVWNVHLEEWKTEDGFWSLYETKYSILLEKTRQYLRGQSRYLRSQGLNSKAAIFLSAGFDASEWEGGGMQRHKVNVPTEFYARLTRDIIKIAAEDETGVEGRIISVLEGGYSDRTLCSGVFSHLCGLASDGPIQPNQGIAEVGGRRYNPSWWAKDELEALEEAVHSLPVEVKRPRNATPPTYSSPTQASTARAVVPPKGTRRSVSGLAGGTINGHGAGYLAPSPPLPEVHWTVAAVEMSKLLIPSGRQTESCRYEDLNAEATRIRRERQLALSQDRPMTAGSVAPAVVIERPPTRTGLRDRKAKPSHVEDETDLKSRRKTVAGSTVVPIEKKPRQSRRLSAASTIVSENQGLLPSASASQALPAPTTDSAANPGPARPDPALVVKKTRVRKQPAASRGHQAPKPNATPTRRAGRKETPLTPPSEPARNSSSPDGISALANDVRKIRITIVNKSKQEAREPAGAESATTTYPAGNGNNPFSPSSSVVNQTADATLIPNSSPPPSISHSSPILSPTGTASPISNPGTPPRTHMDTPIPNNGSRVFVQYQPEGTVPEALKRFEPQQPLKWMEPNVPGTPVPAPTPIKREDLPVFSSTGVIPFSPPKTQGPKDEGHA